MEKLAQSCSFQIDIYPKEIIYDLLSLGCEALSKLASLNASSYCVRQHFCCLELSELASFNACGLKPVFSLCHRRVQEQHNAGCFHSRSLTLIFLQGYENSSRNNQNFCTESMQMQVTTGRYHTLLLHDSSVYSCGSSLCGVLGHGQDTTQCVAFSRITTLSHVIHMSASHNHAAFVMQSGEVFTCGDNSSFCCGLGEVRRAIFRPTAVEALKGIPCKQVATGLSFTVILSKDGHVFTCGSNTHGQLGHGDNLDRATPTRVESLEGVVQVAAGASYTFALTNDGAVYSFGSCSNFCLGHGDQHDELLPRTIQSLMMKKVHVVRVSAGDEHAVVLDSNGHVYTWGRGYCGALGHGDENDKTTPELLSSLKSHLAVQVCARKRKTFVLTDEGSVFAFGWMGFGSLGFPDRGCSDKVLKPRVLDNLRSHYISQISTGLYHTVALTNRGLAFGFGDNERAQLGHEWLRGCLKPTEIMLQTTTVAAQSS
ncbi:Ultraviolet-B receptor UVR8 [Platanthera zijinensis]|uniref:Ultraviolet-B receptor UVR8 n=1 Tax=Platanthera zijinensis TaxID=2320716 RepID=A0AAP0GG40_9ASPA